MEQGQYDVLVWQLYQMDGDGYLQQFGIIASKSWWSLDPYLAKYKLRCLKKCEEMVGCCYDCN